MWEATLVDLSTILLILLVIVTAAAATLAWLLYGPRGTAAKRPSQPAARREAPAPPAPSPVVVALPSPQPAPVPRANPQPPAPPPTLDPTDPTVQQYERAIAAIEPTFRAIRAVPEAFEERAAMRVAVMAVEQQLVELRPLLVQTDPQGRTLYAARIEAAGHRLASIRKDAAAIDAVLAQLAEEEQRLRQVADALGDELAGTAALRPYPINTQRTSHIGASFLWQVSQLPSRVAIGSFNALKVRLRLARELQGEIEGCRAALRELRGQREALLVLLASPELADDPPWRDALDALQRRAPPDGAVAELVAEADRLFARRRALFDLCTPLPQGGVLLPEERLPAILAEAEAIRAGVRDLWRRARTLARATRGAL
jgi:hypothetical protein